MTEKTEDKFVQWLLFATGISSILIIILIIAFIFREGLPAILQIGFFNFLFGMVWNPDNGIFGVFPMLAWYTSHNINSPSVCCTIVIMLFYISGGNCTPKYEKNIKTNHTRISWNTFCSIRIFWSSNYSAIYENTFWWIRFQCTFRITDFNSDDSTNNNKHL